MPTIEFKDVQELRDSIGKEVAVSGWVEITQQRIDQFAEATGDRQWIHVDPARAREESPFGTTIAHGFLTLSLVPQMMDEALALPTARLAVNYGLDRLRFISPVKAGSRVRARFTPIEVEDVPGGTQLTLGIVVDIDGEPRPACAANFISRRYS